MNPLYLFGGMAPVRKLLFMKALAGGGAASEYTATGNPLTFITNLAKPLKSLVARFVPSQSGTGDPSPENVRPVLGMDGVNVWQYPENKLSINRNSSQTSNGITFTPVKDANNKTIAVHVEGTATQTNTFFSLNYVNGTTLSVPSGSYKCYGGNSRISIQGFIINANGNEQNIFDNKTDDVTEFTIPSDAKASWVRLRVNVQTPVDETIYPIIVNADEQISTYAVEFPAMGNNLCSAEIEQGTIVSGTGRETSSDTRVRTNGYILLKKGKYIISATGVGQAIIYVYGIDKAYKQSESLTGFGSLPRTFTLTDDRLVRFVFRKSSNNEDVTPLDVSNVMLNTGETALPYEPFTNTIYGGTLDLVSGVLTAEYASDTFVWGDGTGSADLTNVTRKAFVMSHNVIDTTTKDGKYCDKAKFLYDFSSDQVHFYTSVSGSTSVVRIYLPLGTADTEKVQVCYKLGEPITFQLTPQQITALVGTNTVWADVNGDCEVVYLKKG